MRTLVLIALISIASGSQLAAQGVTPTAPTTYPEQGTFCGFLTLCSGAQVSKGKR